MTREQATKMVEANLECIEREASGADEMCRSHNCDECSLNYEQGNVGEQKEWLRMAIEALEQKPCEDVVSRAEVLKGYIEIERADGVEVYSDKVVPTEYINNLPFVTPTRKKGKWIIDDKEARRIWHCHCSNCKKDPQDHIGGTENWWLVRLPKYCPNCGIQMEIEKEE